MHNGIIENYQEIRDELEAAGHKLSTETDTEVIAQLISVHLENGDDLESAVRATLKRLQGTFAIAVLHRRHAGSSDRRSS